MMQNIKIESDKLDNNKVYLAVKNNHIRRGMLYVVAQVLYRNNWNIIQTKGYSSLLGHVVDEFIISPMTDSPKSLSVAKLKKELIQSFEEKRLIRKGGLMPELKSYSETKINLASIDDHLSSITITTLDRPGLLCNICKHIYEAGFYIESIESIKRTKLVEDIIILSNGPRQKLNASALLKLRTTFKKII